MQARSSSVFLQRELWLWLRRFCDDDDDDDDDDDNDDEMMQ
jgi:hypothetical protein